MRRCVYCGHRGRYRIRQRLVVCGPCSDLPKLDPHVVAELQESAAAFAQRIANLEPR